jgi:tripartite-type tricarboxylate transporter receptor subunit TctC
MTLVRRQVLQIVGGAAMLPTISRIARAQTYPARPVRVIVPVAAGGPTDTIARLIAQKVSDRWGQQVYIENMPTGAGNVAVGVAATARPDGYTILMPSSSFVVNPNLYAKIRWDPVRDFAPITMAVASAHVLVVHPSIPANNLKELVALVKANPGKYSYASPGAGTTGQLAGELFKLSLGLDLLHVPFNGGNPAITSTIGGHTPIAFTALPAATSNIQGGKLRALVVTSGKRSPAFPDVPTMAESGFPDQTSVFIQAVLAPMGTPKDIVDLWYREMVRIVALPDIKERLAVLGFDPVANTPEEFGAWIKTEVARWAKVIHDANIPRIE